MLLALEKTEKRNELQLVKREIPILNEGEVLIQVAYCGVCGSDLHAARHAQGYEFVPKPIILGHEISGTVVKVHPNNKLQHLLNKQVIVEPGQYCNECEQCKNGRENICSNIRGLGLHFDGGMAEYVKVNENFVHIILNSLPLDIASLAEPLSIAVHAVEKRGQIQKNQNVLVQGPGIIGFFVSLVALQKGAKVTLAGLARDWEARLKHAPDFGITPKIVGEENVVNERPIEYDVLFECSGSAKGAVAGLTQLKKGGKAIFVALFENNISLPMTDFVRREIEICMSYGCFSEDFTRSLNILNKYKDKLKEIVTFYSLQQGENAFYEAMEQKNLKPILQVGNKHFI